MKTMNDWSSLLSALTEDIPAEELEADILLADIAGKISAERIKRGLSQQAFAELLGVTQSQVSKIENGDNNFTIRRLVSIAHKLSMPLKILFGEKNILNYSSTSSVACNSKASYQQSYANQVTIVSPTLLRQNVSYH